ncbi:polysaccharide biosynthesis/export family protein [Brevundimonas kwangchunensis]|uniref:Polysaccharide biosynthesis/export family protein n=1 Tax=Brevundimonas kwangchunensis TaxID=322163 RepID=A0ABN1GGQ3_9CAUL
MRVFFVSLAVAGLAGCSSTGARQDEAAGRALDIARFASASQTPSAGYVIGAADKLKITVFQVADLSFDEIIVDPAGNLQLPLVGSVHAAGLTPLQLSVELERLLAERYIRQPRVNIALVEAASQKITVDGAVTKPGVYEMRGSTSLLQAVAMAEGPTRTAALDSVAVFRQGEQGRMVAMFDLGAIRSGTATDPILQGDDIVIVDTSRLNATLREVLAALPGLAFFTYF